MQWSFWRHKKKSTELSEVTLSAIFFLLVYHKQVKYKEYNFITNRIRPFLALRYSDVLMCLCHDYNFLLHRELWTTPNGVPTPPPITRCLACTRLSSRFWWRKQNTVCNFYEFWICRTTDEDLMIRYPYIQVH